MCAYLNRTGPMYYFRRPVPKDLLGHFKTSTGGVRKEWKFSLGTTDRETAKPLLRPFEIDTDRLIAEARAASAQGQARDEVLSDRELEEAEAAAMVAAAKAERHAARKEIRTLLRQRMQLTTAQLEPEWAAAHDLLQEKEADLAQLRQKVAELEAGLGTLQPNKPNNRAATPGRVSIMELVDDWAGEFGKPDTVAAYTSYLTALDAFLGQPDARTVTENDIGDWRNHLRTNGGLSGRPVSNSTINGAYMAAVATVFEHARGTTRKLASNPAAGIKALRVKKQPTLRPKSITDEEAGLILADALKPGGEGLSAERVAAKRWCPWLMAYTGARVIEVAQLRKEDVGVFNNVPYIHITPEAGKNKTETARKVPLHPHLVQQGFLDFVAARPNGPLFYDPSKGRGGRLASQAKKVGQYLCTRVRDLGIDVAQPNHGWRHRMETMNNRYDLRDKIVRMILGHAGPDSNAGYGDEELLPMLREIEKLPAYQGPGLPAFEGKRPAAA